MEQPASIIILVAGFPFFFAAVWCAVVLLLSVMGGWRRLAARYPARRLPSGRRFGWQHGRVGFVSYKRCLHIHSSAEGLHLAVWFAFRPGHPPLFLPWSAIHPRTARRFLREDMVEFEVGSPRVAALWLPKAVFDAQAVAVGRPV